MAMNAIKIPIVLALATLTAGDGVSPFPALADGVAAAVSEPLGFIVVTDETGDGVATAVLVDTVEAGLATLLAPHDPVKVPKVVMFVSAAGEEPQFSDWDIQMMFCSRSKTATHSVSLHPQRSHLG
jgi:hypothetical protein